MGNSLVPSKHPLETVGEIKAEATTSWEIDPWDVGTGSGAGEEVNGLDKKVNLGQKLESGLQMWGKSIIVSRMVDVTLISLLPPPEGSRFSKETRSLFLCSPHLDVRTPGSFLASSSLLVTSHGKTVPADDS